MSPPPTFPSKYSGSGENLSAGIGFLLPIVFLLLSAEEYSKCFEKYVKELKVANICTVITFTLQLQYIIIQIYLKYNIQ